MKRFAAALVAALVVSGCAGEAGQGTASAPTQTSEPRATTIVIEEPAAAATALDTEEYRENFEFVWATVNQEFYDPTFGGVDWGSAHERYLPKVGAVDSDEAFVNLLNEMLFELGVSHLFVVPPDVDFIDPTLTTEGELGIQVRRLDGEWVISAVHPDTPAAHAGLQPGYLLDSIDGQAVTDIAASAYPLPPLHEQGVRSGQILAVEEFLYGEPGADITLGYRDAADETRQTTLTFQHRGPSAELIPGFPPVFTTLKMMRLDGGVEYIGFDPFAPSLVTPILQTIEAIGDAPGLILDVRGNHGGDSTVGKQIIDSLVSERALIWTWRTKDGTGNTYTNPSATSYEGPVVVLVDVVSGSAAEAFAAGLQAMGRAVIAGERTSGRLLGGEIAQLPIGAVMIYPASQPIMADGFIVEGSGVIPDLPVAVQRSDLLAGTDPILRAAIDYLQSSSP